VSFSDGANSWVLHRTDDWKPKVRQALALGVVGHNVAFDMAVLAANGFPLEEIFEAYAADKITCTMAREKLADIATGEMATQRAPKGPGYALDTIVKRRLGVELSKDAAVRLEYERLIDVPVSQWPAAFHLYAANDALYTHRLWAIQIDHPDEYRQARAAFWIQLMAAWGTCVDIPRLDGLRVRYEAEYAQAGQDLVASGLARYERRKGQEVMVRNVKRVGERIVQAYANQGKDYPRTDGGGPCTDQAACEDSGDPSLARYSEYMTLATKINKEIPALYKPLIHAYYDPLVETGRTSCAKPNLQNLPREGGFRECLIPRPGNVFVCADFSMFELVTWAQCCLEIVGWSKMAEALNEGLDPHCLIAAELLGWTYEHAIEAKSKKHPEHKLLNTNRQIGKAVNFGAPGGAGIERLCHQAKNSYGVHVEPDLMRHIKFDVWGKRWPEYKPYFERIEWAVDTHGAIEQLYSGRRRGGVSFTDACNGPFQGLAADIAKDAGFKLARECYLGSLKGCRIVNFVHDEYVVEVPEHAAKTDTAPRIEKLLVDAARPWLPGVKLGVEVTVSRRYKGDYL